jgi:hypothetical protein
MLMVSIKEYVRKCLIIKLLKSIRGKRTERTAFAIRVNPSPKLGYK